ncbi:hypothetical protein [Kitasatospora purpeofusca]|uniref:hypothetical protein n=1 Tax=Kitasatospora purpeofusca TaxID=67352 RepID=UPI00068F9771|nr:hypothetical protein [Kitasatospora purpeofusca]
MIRQTVETVDHPFVRAMMHQNTSNGIGDSYRMALVAGGLSDEQAWQYALSITVGAMGDAPPWSRDLNGHTEREIRRHQELLRTAEVFVISPAAHAAVMAAAATLEIADTATLDREADLPAPTGLLMLPEPIVHANRNGALSDTAAFGWAPVQLFNAWPPVKGGIPGVRVTSFMDRDGPIQPDEWRATLALARTSGMPLPLLVPDGVVGMSGDGRLAHLDRAQLHEVSRSAQQVQLNLRQSATEVRGQVEEVGEWTGGQVVEDPTQDFVRRYMFAFWRLAAQKSMEVSLHRPSAVGLVPRQGRATRSAAVPDVRVVQLGAPARAAGEVEDAGQEHRVYHHRFPVRMHKVRQWYPSQGVHRIIWRGPYIKGPAGAPLVVTESAYAVR